MRITADASTESDPIALKIPQKLRTLLFKSDFEWDETQIANIPIAKIERNQLPDSSQQALILLLALYPHSKARELTEFSLITLQLQTKTILKLCIPMGRIDMLWHAKKYYPALLKLNTPKDNYLLIKEAVIFSQASIINWFEQQMPDEFRAMIDTYTEYDVHIASEYGDLETLQWIRERAPHIYLSMIEKKDYTPVTRAAEKGHFHLIKWFKEQAPEHFKEMLQRNEYAAFYWAAEQGNLQVLQWFKLEVSEHFDAMIQAYEYGALKQSLLKKHIDISNWLLKNTLCLAYAQANQNDYAAVLEPFISQILTTLHQEVDAHKEHNNTPFEMQDKERIKQFFYVMKYLIEQNIQQANNEIRVLLSIPSIKNSAHQSNNELLQCARDKSNRFACELLLNIESVRALAVRNQFYPIIIKRPVDLRAHSQDRESSLNALSPSEERRLKSAIDHYQPRLNELTVPVIIEQLRAQLIARYNEHPASIVKTNGTPLTLPYDFSALSALNLAQADYQMALKAYYKHKEHTAWRYLLKPNPWLNERAVYTASIENVPQPWSSFESYQALIAMLWLAAIDTAIACTPEFTLQIRLEHFIEELALIGRAHNWDKKESYIHNGRTCFREVDDEAGDNPACYSGTKSRLFQSIVGHPLINGLTQNELTHELKDFVLEWFKSKITALNRPIIQNAFRNYFVSMESDDAAPLIYLNIPHLKQELFKQHLAKKYGQQYLEDLSFIDYINTQLTLNPNSSDASEQYHGLKLDGITHFSESAALNTADTPKVRHLSLFARHNDSDDESEVLESNNQCRRCIQRVSQCTVM